jgi:hypothetical protein
VEWTFWKKNELKREVGPEEAAILARLNLKYMAGDGSGDRLGDVLALYHAQAQEKGEPVDLPNGLGVIHPGGGKIGGVKYCKFRVERPDCILLIADQERYTGDWPNVKIEIGGERCLVYPGGAEEAYKSARRLLDGLGACVHQENVSRADFCADFPGLRMDDFVLAYRRRRWTCRANRHHPDTSNGVSLYFGAGAIMLRIYDKKAEMEASALRGQPAKYQHMIAKRWNGVEPESAVRVEFQCRRDWLKQYGVTDFDSLLWYARDLLGYLTGVDGTARWFRFLKRKPHPKHPELNETAPLWEFVQRVFMTQFSKPEPLVKIDPDEADVETLLKQALGVLEAAAANRGYSVPWKDTAAETKYTFVDTDHFLDWCRTMLCSTAVRSGRWKVSGYREPDYKELVRVLEAEAMLRKKIQERASVYE